MSKKNEVMQKKNQGFSLVELIVVIAIMAILAVIFAPRLTQYLDKARKSSDNEIVSGIHKAVQVGTADQKTYDELFVASHTPDYKGTFVDILSTYYDRSGNNRYTLKTTGLSFANDLLGKQIVDIIGNEFQIKSDDAGADTKIYVKVFDRTHYEVYLDYDNGCAGTPTEATTDYAIIVK